MTWLCVDKDGSEWVFDGTPERGDVGWTMSYGCVNCSFNKEK